MPRRLLLVVAFLWARAAAADAEHERMAAEYAPLVVLHPEERYALANVHHFFSKFRLVLDTPFKKYRFDVDAESIARVTHKGWRRAYTTVEPRWREHWWFESKDGCEWSTPGATCDAVYLRARDPVKRYLDVVAPEVYWRAVDRMHEGQVYSVIQYFFFLMLNDAQNKHDGEWESSIVVVDRELWSRARDGPGRRAAIDQIVVAGHYQYVQHRRDVLERHAAEIFVGDSAHYRHVMSHGGHGGYLFVPRTGWHEASLRCYERVAVSPKQYHTWIAPVRLVRIDSRTPWVRYVGRWGRRYGVLSKLPMSFRFRFKPVGLCKGRLGLGWLKSRFQVIGSAPYGPRFIHWNAWHWPNFPHRPRPTPKRWR